VTFENIREYVNKFHYKERVINAYNFEEIVTFENIREYVEQFVTAQIFCRVQDSSSDTSVLNDW
jgi:hypothetical protein